MSEQQPPLAPSAQAPVGGEASETLANGEWHRMHPLTPLLQGGLVLVIVMGYLIANMRDRLIEMFVPSDFSEYQNEYGGDPVDWVVANNFVFIALGGVLYTGGAWVYARKGFRYHHLVWHLFIDLALLSHLAGIVFFIG